MKKRIIGISFILMLLTNSLNANLLNDMVWAGTKSVINSQIRKAQNYGHHNKHKVKRKRKKTVVYHCDAKASRASGWTESTNLAKAKRGALRQCRKRRVTSTACTIRRCYRK